MHTHNLRMGEHSQDYAMAQANSPLPMLDPSRTFDGYPHADGKVVPAQGNVRVGIGLMLLGILMFSLNDVMGKWLVGS